MIAIIQRKPARNEVYIQEKYNIDYKHFKVPPSITCNTLQYHSDSYPSENTIGNSKDQPKDIQIHQTNKLSESKLTKVYCQHAS